MVSQAIEHITFSNDFSMHRVRRSEQTIEVFGSGILGNANGQQINNSHTSNK